MSMTFQRGGIHPPEYKLTATNPIEKMPIPKKLFIPVTQHIGASANPIVRKGDSVKKGQIIAEASSYVSSNIHASTSGMVEAIDRILHPNGQYTLGIIINPDGKDEWQEGLNIKTENYLALSKEELLNKIKFAGIVGMGGAGFPSHVKLSPPADKPIDTIILNGAECEPFLTADHRLMLEHTEELIEGLKIIHAICNKKSQVFIGIEENKHDAVEKFKAYTQNTEFKVIELPTKYPQGDERQLINAITKRRMREGQLPFDVGCLVHNVGTVFAIYEAVVWNKPLIERVLTVSGFSINSAKNLKALIGTTLLEIAEFCGGFKDGLNQVIVGGPMMGKAQDSLDVPIIKTSSGVLFIENKKLDEIKERPCLRCGKCAEVCPQGLFAAYLADLSMMKDFDTACSVGLKSCMECGSCTFVCPAKREIVNWIRYAKVKVSRQEKLKVSMKK